MEVVSIYMRAAVMRNVYCEKKARIEFWKTPMMKWLTEEDPAKELNRQRSKEGKQEMKCLETWEKTLTQEKRNNQQCQRVLSFCLVTQLCLTLFNPVDCSLSSSSVHGDSLSNNTGVGCHALFHGILPNRDPTQVSCIAGGFFTIWATREAQNTGVGRLSFLQGIFPTQESNWGSRYS